MRWSSDGAPVKGSSLVECVLARGLAAVTATGSADAFAAGFGDAAEPLESAAAGTESSGALAFTSLVGAVSGVDVLFATASFDWPAALLRFAAPRVSALARPTDVPMMIASTATNVASRAMPAIRALRVGRRRAGTTAVLACTCCGAATRRVRSRRR